MREQRNKERRWNREVKKKRKRKGQEGTIQSLNF